MRMRSVSPFFFFVPLPHRSCFSQVRYRADWSDESAFRSILISPRMLVDHMPDVVMGALKSLTSENAFPLCPSSVSGSQHNTV